MIDPCSLKVIVPYEGNEVIRMDEIPECDVEVYDLYDEKDFKKYIQDVEKTVRTSFEYRQYIKYLRECLDMNKCSFLENIDMDGSFNIKIEQHHYPFTLYDICIIVFNKRLFYHESLSLQMVSKEVMELHYKLMIGLIPLSETAHELVHNQYLFIPIENVLGRYNLFVDYYKEFMLPEHIDVLERIEDYSRTFNRELNKLGLTQKNVLLELQGAYKLPELNKVYNAMVEQIETIKNNGYQLPCFTEEYHNQLDDIKKKKENIVPIYFF